MHLLDNDCARKVKKLHEEEMSMDGTEVLSTVNWTSLSLVSRFNKVYFTSLSRHIFISEFVCDTLYLLD
jgi:hypothetical protein